MVPARPTRTLRPFSGARRVSWVRLGVDVDTAAGDGFTIYRCVRDVLKYLHHSSGRRERRPGQGRDAAARGD